MSTFDLELALDRLAGRLATELPAHLTAAAQAYANGTPIPPGPPISSAEVRTVRAALDEMDLRRRALDLARIVVPAAIEATPSVTAARNAERTWEAWKTLRAARDAAAQALFGRGYLAFAHELAKSAESRDENVGEPVAPPDPAWTAPSGRVLADAHLHSLWRELASPAHGAITILRSASAHPRLFAIEKGTRATLVIPAQIASPASRFAVLHELGHAVLWLSPQACEWPRAVDEAAAAYVTRAMEQPTSGWWEPLAASERARRTQVARALASVEATAQALGVRPPWALWHDPGAQAAYVRAEQIADALPPGLVGESLVAALIAL